MELIIIILLLLVNGIFAMSEIALVSSNRAKLQDMAKKKNKNADVALKLLANPEDFLSTVQIGITLVGILAGAYGGIALAEDFEVYIYKITFLQNYSYEISFAVMVGFITYLSLVIGELVPKTIAFNNPEKVAVFFAPMVHLLAIISKPIVYFLSLSTKFILKLMLIKPRGESPVSEDELKLLLEQGAKHGVFELKETEMIKSILRLADRKVYSIMTNRQDVEWIDSTLDSEEIKKNIQSTKHSIIPVCKESFDNTLGVVYKKDFYEMMLTDKLFNVNIILRQPLYIPDTLPAFKVIERFRQHKVYFAVVTDEHGTFQGIVTLHDIVESILGELPELFEKSGNAIFKREDGSFLIDGLIPVDELEEFFNIKFSATEYSTLGGFLMYRLNKIPSVGDKISFEGITFEIVDMDGKRVDKVLATINA